MNNRSQITHYLLVIAVPAFFFIWKLSAFGLVGADEPRYAQVARDMLVRNDWVTPTLNGAAWLEKPPLYYWQAMIGYKLFGVSDWAARLPSVFDAFLLVLAMYWFLRRLRPGSELDAALIAATAAGIVGFSRAASTDMPLASMFSIAMLGWYCWFESGEKKYLAVFYGFLALAMLAKGPVAPFLAVLIVTIFAAFNGSVKTTMNALWIPGVLLFCAIGLPWYGLVQLRNPQFFREFIIEHNLARFGTNLYHHPEPFWYYVPVSLLGWLPWTVLVLAGIVRAIRQWRSPHADCLHVFLLSWIAIVVTFFSISQSKLPGYVLPAMPAGALLAAACIRAGQIPIQLPSWGRNAIAGWHSATIAVLIFCALIVRFLILRHRVPWGNAVVPLTAAIAVGVIVLVVLIRFEFRVLRIATLIPLVLTLAIALRFGAQPLDEKLSARPIVAELRNFAPDHLPVAVFLVPRETEFGLAFYRNQIIPRYELGQVPAGEHVVVAAQGYPRGVAKSAGRNVTYLGNFAPQKLDFFYVPARHTP